MKRMQRAAWGALFLALALPGCGDDGGTQPLPPDASMTEMPDAASTPDAGSDPTAPVMVPLSTTGNDAFFGVAFDQAGNFYATGYTASGTGNASDRAMVVAKFLADGTLDTSFGEDGVAIKNVAVGGGSGEQARGIVIQSTGKIVIAGSVEHDVEATGALADDRDVALVRFNADGTIDEDFGTAGVVILDLNSGLLVSDPEDPQSQMLVGADAPWSLSVYSDDKLLVHGAQRAESLLAGGPLPRTDTDWVAVRLSADGALDQTFGFDGKFMLDLQGASASARSAVILPDGSVIGSGYSKTPAFGSVNQPVIYKLTPAGELDATFGQDGVFHQDVLAGQTEVYSVALQGTKLVTTGYGRQAAEGPNDWVSLRLTANGELDSTWGTGGVVQIDVATFNDNSRCLVALDDSRVILAGGGRRSENDADAMVVMLGENGQVDESFGASGRRIYDLGGGSDFFWGAAVSPDQQTVVLVGHKGMGSAATETDNDDAAILIVPVGR